MYLKPYTLNRLITPQLSLLGALHLMPRGRSGILDKLPDEQIRGWI